MNSTYFQITARGETVHEAFMSLGLDKPYIDLSNPERNPLYIMEEWMANAIDTCYGCVTVEENIYIFFGYG